MLSRLETVYLGLLRGFILIVATLALLAAALLVASSVPEVLTRMGITKSEPQSSSLSEFIAEQKPVAQDSENAEPADDAKPIDPVIRQAAQNFYDYLGSPADAPLKGWEQGIQSYKDSFPAEIANAYAASVERLSEELKASKGKRLSEQRVATLVDWHKNRFASNYAAQQAERAAADAAFRFKMLAAFGAFLIFAFITFIFLFVRIERNLRLMRVEVENGYAQTE